MHTQAVYAHTVSAGTHRSLRPLRPLRPPRPLGPLSPLGLLRPLGPLGPLRPLRLLRPRASAAASPLAASMNSAAFCHAESSPKLKSSSDSAAAPTTTSRFVASLSSQNRRPTLLREASISATGRTLKRGRTDRTPRGDRPGQCMRTRAVSAHPGSV
jgi:hypothetical protein